MSKDGAVVNQAERPTNKTHRDSEGTRDKIACG